MLRHGAIRTQPLTFIWFIWKRMMSSTGFLNIHYLFLLNYILFYLQSVKFLTVFKWCTPGFAKRFLWLFTRWIQKINLKDLGKVPFGEPVQLTEVSPFLTFSCFLTRSFFSASVRRSSSMRWSSMPSICRSALCVLLFSSLSLLSSMWLYMGGGGGGGGAIITLYSSSFVFMRSCWTSWAWRRDGD